MMYLTQYIQNTIISMWKSISKIINEVFCFLFSFWFFKVKCVLYNDSTSQLGPAKFYVLSGLSSGYCIG